MEIENHEDWNIVQSAQEEISDWFWSIIQSAEKDEDKLSRFLSELSKDQLRHFIHEFAEASLFLRGEPYEQYVGDVGEDGLSDVAYWVASQGKEYFFQVLQHPELMPERIELGNRENFFGVAENVYLDRFDDVDY